ncbi:MAG: YIP1 family protein [Porticoccaceae bacterium]
MTDQNKFDIHSVINNAKAIITTPATYFQTMPKSGGFANPVIFVAVMAAAAGVIAAVLSLFGSSAGMIGAGLSAIILMPIFALIGTFIGAGILFVIWKLMGSPENYETAFRCLASMTAIYPVVALLSIIPYIGTIVGVVWATYLVIEASVAVHGRDRKTSQIVFGIIGVLLLISNVSSEYAARKAVDHLEDMGSMMEEYSRLPPDEMGKKMGEFLKGMEEGMKEQ